MNQRKSVAFVSQRNVCRSLIAEVILRKHGRLHFNVQSFGFEPDRIHYLVYRMLHEKGYDLNFSFSKSYEVVENQRFDIIVLMHPGLKERLPEIPYHYQLFTWEFEDPTLQEKEEEEILADLRELHDRMEQKIKAESESWLKQKTGSVTEQAF